jgi:hypothetical protein
MVMRVIQVSGFHVTIRIAYDQNMKDDIEALEAARREIAMEILREKAYKEK